MKIIILDLCLGHSAIKAFYIRKLVTRILIKQKVLNFFQIFY
jgi:hypothetical protein